MDTAAPDFACIYLSAGANSSDGRLFAHEILRWDLRETELVTLSACKSALLRFDLLDNLYGIGPALLRAGAGAVIGALWPVTADVAETFFNRLYAALSSGSHRFEAFADAQAETRAQHPQLRDWTSFVYLGG